MHMLVAHFATKLTYEVCATTSSIVCNLIFWWSSFIDEVICRYYIRLLILKLNMIFL